MTKYTFLCIALLVVSSLCNAQTNLQKSINTEHKITILDSDDMTASMKLKAEEVLRRGLRLGDYHKTCILLRDYFQENYPEYTWHAVDYNSYAIHYSKSINFQIDDDRRIVLFANSK